MRYRYFFATDGHALVPDDPLGTKLESLNEIYSHAERFARRVMEDVPDRSSWSQWGVVVMDEFSSVITIQAFPGSGNAGRRTARHLRPQPQRIRKHEAELSRRRSSR